MIKITNLNHFVLYVADIEAMQRFYEDVMGFVVREKIGQDAVFLHASGSDNHHDLGIIYAGENAQPVPSAAHLGLYHAAWEVGSIGDLEEAKTELEKGNYLLGESEHGNSISLYGHDPEGNEFEVFWMMPKEDWKKRPFGVHHIDWDKELRTYGKK